MKGPERPYVTYGASDRDPAEEHHDAVELLVRECLRKFSGHLLHELSKQADVITCLAAEEIMEKAYQPAPPAEPSRPLRLMGTSEIAQFLELNHRSRVLRLREAKSLNFPDPVAELKMGPVWLAEDIEEWAPTWRRKVGHPVKEDK